MPSIYHIQHGTLADNSDMSSIDQNTIEFCNGWASNLQEYQIQTSGSTGNPKTVIITRAQMKASAQATINALELAKGDNALICLNTNYIGGRMMLVRCMIGELNGYIVEPSSNPLRDLPENLSIDFMAVVSLQMEAMIDDGYANRLNTMKAIIIGGAPISYSLAQKIKKLHCLVYATYGMTETVSHIALKQLNGTLASQYYEVLEGVELGQDDRGCLTVLGDVTNNERVTTNDLVNLVTPRSFEWLGRYDNVINTGGVKVHPEQVEEKVNAVFSELGLDYNYFVYGMDDDKLGKKVVLFVESDPIESSLQTDLLNKLKEELPQYHNPKQVICKKEFKYTDTGKIKREETAEK